MDHYGNVTDSKNAVNSLTLATGPPSGSIYASSSAARAADECIHGGCAETFAARSVTGGADNGSHALLVAFLMSDCKMAG